MLSVLVVLLRSRRLVRALGWVSLSVVVVLLPVLESTFPAAAPSQGMLLCSLERTGCTILPWARICVSPPPLSFLSPSLSFPLTATTS